MTIATKSATDVGRAWFDAKPEDTVADYPFGMILADNTVEWFPLPHADFDGIGWLSKILRDRGYPISQVPLCQHGPRSFAGHAFALLRNLRRIDDIRDGWCQFEAEQGLRVP